MSSNPQWKMFQPPIAHNTHLQDLLDIQHPNSQAKVPLRNGSYSSDYPSSPRDTFSTFASGSNSSNRYNSYSIGTFKPDSNPMGDSVYNTSSTSQTTTYDSSTHPPIRETGIIEKLLHSYGFIQCCERQARLFFHFSQFSGNIEHLKIGDPVEFEMTYDRRTGKPIASTVTKIAPEVVLSEARVTGTVTTELKGEGSGDNTGRISYENRGECFFLPYTKDDVEGNVTLKAGDAVSFQIATNQRGNLGACHIRFENPAHPVKYHGVVCSMKESFGFIERADVVKEIFFHFSEAKMKEELQLGDDVEFNIQTRNENNALPLQQGKEVACNITKLPTGSVVFEDVSPEQMRGQVLKPLERNSQARLQQNDPLPGRIRYRAPDHSEMEVTFGDKDQCGEFTLRHGDWVQFQIATDRRDQLRRATHIMLLDESFYVSGEKRERGVVCSVADGFGYIRCEEREQKLIFNTTEVLRLGQEVLVGEEIEFTVDPVTLFSSTSTRQCAIRIKHLPIATVQFETLVERGFRGIIVREAQEDTDNKESTQETPGLINYQLNGIKKSLVYLVKDCDVKNPPRLGDKVTFDIYQVKKNKELIAMNVEVHYPPTTSGSSTSTPTNSNGTATTVTTITTTNSNGNGNNNKQPRQGFVAAIKDGFGFIETKDHTKEVFFHFSTLDGSPDLLEIGREVEYVVGRGGIGGGCASAETVRVLPRGSVSVATALEPTLNGTVTRTLRAFNPNQTQYPGVIETEDGTTYEFGIMGLACKREIVQVGDPVTFQADVKGRATNIVPVRKKRRATVDAIKGGFGFLSLEVEDGKRLFFHMSEVRGNPADLQPGDTVEFVMMTNPRTGKSSACNVTKISSGPKPKPSPRPERLMTRLRLSALEEATCPRVMSVRLPRGPDGTRGFRPRRSFQEIMVEINGK